jgi:hypothetical protein
MIEYSLGLLGDSESGALEPSIERHPQTAAFVRQTMDSLAVMVMDLPPVAIPDYATDNLLKRVRAVSQTSPPVASDQVNADQVVSGNTAAQQGIIPQSSAEAGLELQASAVYEPPYEVVYDPDAEAAKRTRKGASWAVTVLQSLLIAGAVLGGIWAFFLNPLQQDLAIGQLLEQYSAEPGAVSQPLVDDDGNSLGVLVRQTEGNVLVVLDVPPPRGQVYQAWQLDLGQDGAGQDGAGQDTATSLGTASERAFVVPEGTQIGASFVLTLEPEDGSNQPTTPFLARLIL